jgi:hypothetical protein
MDVNLLPLRLPGSQLTILRWQTLGKLAPFNDGYDSVVKGTHYEGHMSLE